MIVIDDYILTNSLRKNTVGEVFLTQKKGHKELFATKRIDILSEKPENITRLKNEINLLKKMYHPNIVNLKDIKVTENHYYIIMEYCNGGFLSDCLRKYIELYHCPFSEKIVQYLMKQIVPVLEFLHTNKIIHRNLKLDNILVNFNSNEDKKTLNMMNATVKITDFLFSTILHKSKANLTYSILGTPANMEPQILYNLVTNTPNIKGYDEKADIWSLGTVCYEMLVGHKAFSGKSMDELFQKVKQGKYTLPSHLSEEVVSFINGMLQKDTNIRLSAKELKNHDFLMKNVNQFKPVDVRKLPATIGPGGIMICDSNIGVKNENLHENVWDIFAQPIIQKHVANSQRRVEVPAILNQKHVANSQRIGEVPIKLNIIQDPYSQRTVAVPVKIHRKENLMTEPKKHYNNNSIPQMVEQQAYVHHTIKLKTEHKKHYNHHAITPMIQQPYPFSDGNLNNTTQIIINNYY